jgi:hypothetical protein
MQIKLNLQNFNKTETPSYTYDINTKESLLVTGCDPICSIRMLVENTGL